MSYEESSGFTGEFLINIAEAASARDQHLANLANWEAAREAQRNAATIREAEEDRRREQERSEKLARVHQIYGILPTLAAIATDAGIKPDFIFSGRVRLFEPREVPRSYIVFTTYRNVWHEKIRNLALWKIGAGNEVVVARINERMSNEETDWYEDVEYFGWGGPVLGCDGRLYDYTDKSSEAGARARLEAVHPEWISSGAPFSLDKRDALTTSSLQSGLVSFIVNNGLEDRVQSALLHEG